MKFKREAPAWKKNARKGFRGYPVATVAYYGPDASRASKVAVAIVTHEGGEPVALQRWFTAASDARFDRQVAAEVGEFLRSQGVRSVVVTDGIIGCPHEEGVDYPEGEACPRCSYWASRDRWSGKLVQ